jgi:hypothetical protein
MFIELTMRAVKLSAAAISENHRTTALDRLNRPAGQSNRR